jgi:anaerobic magnesium-protoporphyrin IX monomethyl ester cyclase
MTMRILLVNPPYRANSIHGMGPQVPLGLLAVGGPLLDAGHEVRLLNAEDLQLTDEEAVSRVRAFAPDAVMTGHSGSTPAHPACLRMLAAIKAALPEVLTIYGGVYPTFHAREILASAPQVDVIVRGEGEAVAVHLMEAVAARRPLRNVEGIAFREAGKVIETAAAPLIRDLDTCRVGWELIEDWDRHQCWGLGRAAIIQFSRGCPHRCSFCGQREFWGRWRHRDPVKLAGEIELLHRRYGVRFITFADENPTTSPKLWRRFLEELAARTLPVSLTASIRASDICRDAELLPLYRQAGFTAILMGVETTDPETIARIGKGSKDSDDIRAVKLLREHGIISILSHVAGLADESWGRGWRSLRRLIAYDPDLLNAMYATPHDWTAFGEETSSWAVSEQDLSRWDYRHPVLASPHLRPWQLFLMVKFTELIMHVRPQFLWRMVAHPGREMRRQLRWCWRNAAKVWRAEAAERLFAPGAGATGMLTAPPRTHLPPARGDRISTTARRPIAKTGGQPLMGERNE